MNATTLAAHAVAPLAAGEFHALPPSASWLLMSSLVLAVGGCVWRGIVGGEDGLPGAEAFADDQPTPWVPGCDTPPRKSWAAYGDVLVVDHTQCADPDCDTIICVCELPDGGQCVATVERACTHRGSFWCDVHRLGCDDCRFDLAHDGGWLA